MKRIILTTSLLLLGMGTAFALDTSRFRESGVIKAFERQSLNLTLEESTYKLSPAAVILAPSGQRVSIDALRVGQIVRFNLTTPTGSRAPLIKELMVLPGK